MKPTPEFEAAVQKLWEEADPEGGLVAGFFLIAEGVDAEGDQMLAFCWSENVKTYHLRGWLHEALDTQLAGQVVAELEDE